MASRRSLDSGSLSHISVSAHLRNKASLIWMKQTAPLYKPLSTNIIREVCQYITFCRLLGICAEADIELLNPIEKKIRIFCFCSARSLFPTPQGRCICIGDDQMFLSGGCARKESLYEFSDKATVFDCGQLVPLRPMRRARHSHGLYYHEACKEVYVFGGFVTGRNPTDSCEQYSLASDHWSTLPRLRERMQSVHTCGDRGKVYLCGEGARNIEMFTIATKKVDATPLALGHARQSHFPAVWKGQLIIFQRNSVQRWDLDTYRHIVNLASSIECFPVGGSVIKDELVVVSNSMCYSIDLNTMKVGPSYENIEIIENSP